MSRPLFLAEVGVASLLLLGAACGRGALHGRGPDASVATDLVVAATDVVVVLDARAGALDSMRVDLASDDARPGCGNGRFDPGEECDDGNDRSGDGCSSTCQLECGDAGVAPCLDPGSFPGSFPQSPWYLCCAPPRLIACGDGVLASTEVCDDANTRSGDGCASDCKTVEDGYHCLVPGTRCPPICGDGEVKGGETCDDGNREPGDGCSRFCLIEPGWDCSINGCVRRAGNDGGWEVQPPVLYCGDEVVSGAEECDRGLANGAADSTCSLDCAYLFCGDGIVSGSERCDLGRQNGAAYGEAGCTSSCTQPPFCGDGIVDSAHGEECDRGVLGGAADPGPRRCTGECKILLDL
jgi:large repetitive protein